MERFGKMTKEPEKTKDEMPPFMPSMGVRSGIYNGVLAAYSLNQIEWLKKNYPDVFKHA